MALPAWASVFDSPPKVSIGSPPKAPLAHAVDDAGVGVGVSDTGVGAGVGIGVGIGVGVDVDGDVVGEVNVEDALELGAMLNSGLSGSGSIAESHSGSGSGEFGGGTDDLAHDHLTQDDLEVGTELGLMGKDLDWG